MAYNTMTVVRQTPYYINNNMGLIKRKPEDDKETNPSNQAKTNPEQNSQNNYNAAQAPKKDLQQQLRESKESHQRAIASRDANLKNATINIAQVLKDFKNTTKAIGATPELTEEVDTYLSLIEKHTKKEVIDQKFVRSNLKIASALLDNYITETLKRPSKVVENWIDALFLQQINYKFNEEEINKQFLVKFPNQSKEEGEEENSSNEDQESGDENSQNEAEKKLYVPTDSKLKTLFIKAKKYAYANNSKKAMETFKMALDRAIEIEDKETESKILYEIGKIYDKNDYLAQALTSYNKSITATADISVKTKAHYSMAQIYDDVSQFESAITHYMSSISYAGETDNFNAQSTSLVKIGNIYTDKYKNEAFEFLSVAELLAEESKNPNTKGYVSSNIANAFNKFNNPKNALKYYSSAIKEYHDAKVPEKIAINYKRAAELMHDYNNKPKAKVLYKKALKKARLTDNVQLMKELHDSLNLI